MTMIDAFKQACIDEYSVENPILKPVPDMYRALIDVGTECYYPILSKYEDFKDYPCETIGMVLESPHVYEFDNNREPIAPARSRTGFNLKRYLAKHLRDAHFADGFYKLLLIEAVPYQCSCGRDLKNHENARHRDNVFKAVWNHYGKSSFEKRMKKYSLDYIINACTGGKDEIHSADSLNGLVQQSLNSLFPERIKYYSNHPSFRKYKNDSIDVYAP